MKAVHFPFAAGQNEAVDKKILPVGQLRSARNVMMDREGRMVRRRHLRTVDTNIPQQTGTPGELRMPFGDDLLLVDPSSGLGHAVGRIGRFAYEGAFREAMALVGSSGGIGAGGNEDEEEFTEDLRRSYLPVGHFTGVREHGVGASSDGGMMVVGASARTARDGTLVTVSQLATPNNSTDPEEPQAAGFQVELRDPVTMEVFHTYRYREPTEFIGSLEVVTSREQDLCAVVFTRNDGVHVKVFSTGYPFSEFFMQRLGDGSAGVVADTAANDTIVIATFEGGTYSPLWSELIIGTESGGTASMANLSGSISAAALAIQALPDGQIGVLSDEGLHVYQDNLVGPATFVETLDLGTLVPRTGGLAREPDGTWHIVYTLTDAGDPVSHIRSIYITATDAGFEEDDLVVANSILLASQPVWTERGIWAAFEVASSNELVAAATDELAPLEKNYPSGIQLIDVQKMRVIGQLSDEVGGISGGDGYLSAWVQRSAKCRPVELSDGYALTALVQLLETVNIAKVFTFRHGHGAAVRTRTNEHIIANGGVFFTDSGVAGLSYFSAPPELSVSAEMDAESTSLVQQGEYLLAAVLEYTDTSGRIWRSAPSTVHRVTLEDANELLTGRITCIVTRGPGAPNGDDEVRAVIYMSGLDEDGVAAGGPLYRRAELQLGGPEQTVATGELGAELVISSVNPQSVDPNTFTLRTVAVLSQQEELYTLGGELGNDAPPPADFVAVGKTRAWLGGLPDRSLVRCSKPLVPGLGIEWSNFDSFVVSLPEEVTGLAVMDETLVVFTTRGVYLVHGDGPNNQGLGEFSPPQRIPTALGCVNHRSIATNEVGVWYQTRRGIELLPRGFGAPQWVGQGIRDITRDNPTCTGSVALPDGSVRWSMGELVVVWDQRAMAWFVHDFEEAAFGDGERVVGLLLEQSLDDVAAAVLSPARMGKETEREAGDDVACFLETGSLRPGGLNGQHHFFRVNVLGEWLGPCRIRLDFAFDDKGYLPEDSQEWEFPAGGIYAEGDPVTLEQTLPAMKGSAVQLRLSWAPLDATVEQSFAATGMTVWFTPEDMGPRVSEQEKG